MASSVRFARVAAGLVVVTVLLSACGHRNDAQGRYPVTSAVISNPTTQDIQVFEPKAEGPWPVVMALHGVGGSGQDMAELGTRVARAGAVVFAPTYRTDLTTEEGFIQAASDDECAYRFIRNTAAAQHGGDLAQPMVFVGWSLGASFAVAGGLQEQIDPTGQYLPCFGEVPRADVIVAINGCYFEYQGNEVTTPAFDPSQWGNKNADVYLLTSAQDSICPAWQSEQAATNLSSAGYHVTLVHLAGANHYAPVFHDLRDGQWVVITDDPAGDQTVQVILDAIRRRQSPTTSDG